MSIVHFVRNHFKLISVSLVLLALGLALLLFLGLRSKLPNYDGSLYIEGLHERVEVLRDSHGMPHIYAQNEEDLYTAFGYVMAQDRLFQMDFFRRLVRGKLSEVLGPVTLDSDKLFRILTSPKSIDEIFKELAPETQKSLLAYARGVNSFIKTASLPAEFTLIGYQPEPWQAGDSLFAYYLMSWLMSPAFRIESVCALLAQQLGDGKADELCLFKNPSSKASQQEANGFPSKTSQKALEHFMLANSKTRDLFQFSGQGASNAWAVSAKKSNTGNALFAGDPHLGLSLPGIWYEVHLHSPQLNVSGVTIPGTSLLIIGANKNITWSLTTFGEDALDFYYETLDPKNKERYLVKNRFKDMQVLHQNISIKGKKELALKIRITRHGPIIDDILEHDIAKKNQAIAIRWTAHRNYTSPQGIYALGYAKDIDDIEAASEYYNTPGQNWIYADAQGNIGRTHAVCVPTRKNFDGMRIIDGSSTDRYEWGPCLPIKKTLRLRNPKKGWVASANEELPKYLGQALNPYFSSFGRYQRVTEILEGKEKLSVQDFKNMQNDTRFLFFDLWRPILAKLLKNEKLEKEVGEVLNQLLKWDGETLAFGKPAASIFFTMRNHFMNQVLSHHLSEEQLKMYLKEVGLFAKTFVRRVVKQEHSLWFDNPKTKKVETRTDALLRALHSSTAQLKQEFSSNDIQTWHWGDIHGLKLQHPLGRSVAVLGWLLNRGPYPMGGSSGSISKAQFSVKYNPFPKGKEKPSLSDLFAVEIGASVRHIIDLTNPKASLRIIPTGNSGNFMSGYYADQISMFVRGEYRPFSLASQDKVQDVHHRLSLRPKK